MYTVDILTIAIIETEDAFNWYESQVFGLGKQFIAEVDHYISLISQNPYQFNVQFSERFRFATLKRFPYRIVYIINEEQTTVVINSVFHTSRNPVQL